MSGVVGLAGGGGATPLEFSDTGRRALKLHTETPHLVSMGGDRLSTSVTLHPIPQGRVTVGSRHGVDIHVQGTGVLPLHCHIENSEGVVTIYPLSENLSIDGQRVTGPTRLSQGVMLTIGRSNYLRFNHPAEAKLIKSVLPNPRISMAPINFEPETNGTYQAAKFNKKPPVAPRRSPRESLSDSGSDEPPSSIMTKVSKFEYLAAQSYKQAISPKVFSSNVVTVNTPVKDVIGRAPPDLKSFTKHLPQSALNYADLNHHDKLGQQFHAKKPHHSQYVNVALLEPKNVNHRVIVFEGAKQQNLDVQLNNKVSNVNRGNAPSPNFNRNTGTANGDIGAEGQRKNEAEIRWNQAQQDRIKEQEIEKAEQQRLEEILNMCAEYEKQQSEKNKPITPNRIITNGSLPRDKRGQYAPPSPSYSTSPPPSPLDVLHNELLKHNYENVAFRYDREPGDARPAEPARPAERSSPYENVYVQHHPQGGYPPSPRTRIKTFVVSNKENSPKDNADLIENKYAILEAEQILLREAEQILRQNLHNSKEFPPDTDVFDASRPLVGGAPPLVDIAQLVGGPKPSEEESERERQRLERLRKEKRDIVAVIARIKRQMADIEIQEEELHREMELEKALITGEHQSKQLELGELEQRQRQLQQRAHRLEESMRDGLRRQQRDQLACQRRLAEARHALADAETAEARERLDAEQRAFEDLEFHHLEAEADWLASREELQREIGELGRRAEAVRREVGELEEGGRSAARGEEKQFQGVAKHKVECMVRLEEVRARLRNVEEELAAASDESEEFSTSDTDSERSKEMERRLSCSAIVEARDEHVYNMSQSFDEKLFHDKSVLEVGIDKKFPSQDDIDRISKVTSDAPINFDEGRGSLGKKTIESLKEIERIRHLHLCQQGSQVIEQERQRVNALKQRVQEEVKSKWAQRAQVSSSESEENRYSGIAGEQKDEPKVVSDEQDSKESARGDAEDTDSPRPLSETSEMSVEVGTLNKKRKQLTDKQRPLTRYLPIRGSDLDLRQHIESAGHQVVLCPHVIINSSTCRGFLQKKGSKLNGWSRRWFVFDRTKHTFTYYSDKSEKKPRGGAYFQAIEEVYLDHLNSIKSPNPQLSFIVKTHERHYYLMAPSPEAMRIWVDVIFTGAEGYREFEHGT